MHNPANDAAIRLRLLESWLPLAQQANVEEGWDLPAAALERAIVAAAAELATVASVAEAYAILCRYGSTQGARS